MTELEQRLTNEYGKLAEQYAEDQRRLQGQVERLAGQVKHLSEQYDREQTHLAGQVETLAVNMQKLGEHVTTLTDGYESLLQHVNNVIKVSNAVVRDINELIR